MNLNPDQFELDCEQHRLSNGRRALQTFMLSGKLFVVKQDFPEKVILVGIDDHVELEMSPVDFERDAVWYVLDEMPLYLGSPEQQAAAFAPFAAEAEARKVCVYGAAKLPVTI